MRACIAGWGSAVPEQRLTNTDLERRVDTTDQWIRERTGIRERRVAAPGETTASLAIEAGAAAIKHAGITPDAIDLLVLATASPEQLIPHTGAFVGDGLGVRCGSFDLNAGCAGFVYELVIGSSMLEAGRLQHVLVIGAETLSRLVDPLDRGTCILFGDAAAAFVLSASPDDGPGILGWELGCDGSGAGLLEVPAGGSRLPTILAQQFERVALGDVGVFECMLAVQFCDRLLGDICDGFTASDGSREVNLNGVNAGNMVQDNANGAAVARRNGCKPIRFRKSFGKGRQTHRSFFDAIG